MIINLRGTHGSGKSTIVRNVMGTYTDCTEILGVGRKRPWGYLCKKDGLKDLFIPGHYETACGGCDTISIVEEAYDLIKRHASEGRNVLFEGILAQHYAMQKFLELKCYHLRVLILSTPLDQCIADTLKRRDDSGKPTTEERSKKIAETIGVEYRGVNIKFDKLKRNGVNVQKVSRDEAQEIILKELSC